MATKTICDRCGGKIKKLPNKFVVNDRKGDLCNKCFSDFVRFMKEKGCTFYT